jgi:DNA-binding NarL/FixJ family response regulator
MINIFIVDDHTIVREGLKKILLDESDMMVVGEEKNGNELVRRIPDIDCDIMLLDLNIPGKKGVELIHELKKQKPLMKILVLSLNPEYSSAFPTLTAGASGYLCKDVALNELVIAIRQVQNTGRYLSPSLTETVANNLLRNKFDI